MPISPIDVSTPNALKPQSLTTVISSGVNPSPHTRSSSNHRDTGQLGICTRGYLHLQPDAHRRRNPSVTVDGVYLRSDRQAADRTSRQTRAVPTRVKSKASPRMIAIIAAQTIYTAETEMLTDDGLILRLDDVMQAAPLHYG